MFVIYAQSNNKQFNFDPFLDIYAYLRMCDQCRSRSAGTSVPSDQDLNCSP